MSEPITKTRKGKAMSEHTPVVVISGAASGMGRATARLLADAGYTVEGCDAVAADSVAQLDVRDDEAVRRWVDAVVARHGTIDAVVTFAGRWWAPSRRRRPTKRRICST